MAASRPVLFCPIRPIGVADHRPIAAAAEDWLAPRWSPRTAEQRQILLDGAYSACSCVPTASTAWRVFFTAVVVFILDIDRPFEDGTVGQREDYFEEVAPDLLRVFAVPGPSDPGLHPFAALARELRVYLDRHAHPVPAGLWGDMFIGYVRDVGWELRHVARGEPFGTDTYFRRILDGAKGSNVNPLLVEICTLDGELPAADRDHPVVSALTSMVGFLVDTHLDLYSWGKEGPDHPYNIVNTIAREQGVPHRDAAFSAGALLDRVMHLFIRLRAQISPRVSATTRTYLTSLGQYLRGNLQWAAWTPRYPDHELKPMAVTAVPPALSAEPPPYPAIAHWWDLLTIGASRG